MALKFLQDKHTFSGNVITFLWCLNRMQLRLSDGPQQDKSPSSEKC